MDDAWGGGRGGNGEVTHRVSVTLPSPTPTLQRKTPFLPTPFPFSKNYNGGLDEIRGLDNPQICPAEIQIP